MKFLRTFRFTLFKWIADVSSWATANRIVIDRATLSAQATGALAWISTLLIYTSGLLITFTAGHTFWSAIRWCTNKIWLTRACWPITNHATNAKSPTWTWLAWVCGRKSFNQKQKIKIDSWLMGEIFLVSNILTYFWFWSASSERITLIISNTCTNGHMIDHLTFSIFTA